MIDLNYPIPDMTPNPPPWRIDYRNDVNNNEPWYNGKLPEAKTIGLNSFNKPELSIRLAPPNLASSLLDRIAIWLVYENKQINPFESYKFAGVQFGLNSEGRVMWERDP